MSILGVFFFSVIATHFLSFFVISRSDLRVDDLSGMARNLYRYKSADLPPSPQTAAELQIAFENAATFERFGRSWVSPGETASDFFRGVHVGTEFSYVVFASQKIIELIEKNIVVDRRKYMMDATFKICPYGEFTQFLVIHIEYIESVKSN